MSLKVVADVNIPGVEHYLGDGCDIKRVDGRALDAGQLRGADALLVRSVTRVDEGLLSASQVSFVGSATSGFDHVDREYLGERGIAFAHAPGSNANSVVEYVLSAISSVSNRLEHLLAGGTVGIVGYGAIGTALAGRLRALGIGYRIYDPWLVQDSVPCAADLPGVLACDVVSLHPELTTKKPWPSLHLLGAQELEAIPDASVLINASRGPVIDNAALLRRLQAGSGPHTVLDVWEGEPVVDPALLQQVHLGTPHIAGYSLDGKYRATQMLAAALATSLQLPAVRSDSPLGDSGEITIPVALCGAELVRRLLRSRYDIAHDDARLRQMVLGPPGDKAGKAFDRLRRDYRERRELAGCEVRCDIQAADDRALARGLGCRIVFPGETR